MGYCGTCKTCGKKLYSGNKTGYCSTCLKDKEYNDYIQDWKDGKVDGLRGEYLLSNHLRRYIFEKYDNKCSQCGWGMENPFTHTIPLEIEHIDGNYQNNNEDNLTLLCPNCHSLTATYKGANKGNGRKQRKKYTE